MKIFLVRHAEGKNTDLAWQRPEIPLSFKGKKQAEVLGSLSRFKIVDTIITSPLKRSQETAQIVAKALNKPLSVVEEIHERKQSSKIYGLSRTDPMSEQYLKDCAQNRNNWDWKWDPEEESFAEVAKRAIEFKKNLAENYPQKNLLILSHDAFLRSLVATCVLGEEFNEVCFKRFFGSTAIENAGVSLLIYREERKSWKLWYLNDYAHLGTIRL